MKGIKTCVHTDAGLRSLGQPVKYIHNSARYMGNQYAYWTVDYNYAVIRRVSRELDVAPIFIYADICCYDSYSELCNSLKYKLQRVYGSDAGITMSEVTDLR
jgi:hypothetical protein